MSDAALQLRFDVEGEHVTRKRTFRDPAAALAEMRALSSEQQAEGFVATTVSVLDELRDVWRDDDGGFDLSLLACSADPELDERLDAFVEQTKSGSNDDASPDGSWLASRIDSSHGEAARAALVLLLRYPLRSVNRAALSLLSQATPSASHLPAYLSLLAHPAPNHVDHSSANPVELIVALGPPDRATESRLVDLLLDEDFRVADASAWVLATHCTDAISERLCAHPHGWARTSDGFAWALVRASQVHPHARFLEHLEWMHDASRRRGTSARFEKEWEQERIVEAIANVRRRIG